MNRESLILAALSGAAAAPNDVAYSDLVKNAFKIADTALEYERTGWDRDLSVTFRPADETTCYVALSRRESDWILYHDAEGNKSPGIQLPVGSIPRFSKIVAVANLPAYKYACEEPTS